MAKFKMGPEAPADSVTTARLGTAANAGGRYSDTEVGKLVKLAGDSRYAMGAAGDPIDGVILAIDPALQDGYTMGTVLRGGRVDAICDGLQATPGTGTIAVGDRVVTGTVVAVGTALTDATGPKVCKATGAALAEIVATAGVSTLAIPITLATIAADVVTNYTPGYAFKLLGVDFVTTTVASTADKAATLNLEIGSTNVTGGTVALTTAACDTLGEIVAGSAITAANTGTASDTISVEATGITAFAEGAGVLLIKIQNMDTYNSLANVAAVVDTMDINARWKVVSLGNAGAVGDTCVIEKL